ncbi:MAG: hypothetical protein LBR80_08470 [Deltaproteobacteria bacterium]|jgi:hypothetical protein|nr:hypothetical protein [Deltaproteobacteria bacterium]
MIDSTAKTLPLDREAERFVAIALAPLFLSLNHRHSGAPFTQHSALKLRPGGEGEGFSSGINDYEDIILFPLILSGKIIALAGHSAIRSLKRASKPVLHGHVTNGCREGSGLRIPPDLSGQLAPVHIIVQQPPKPRRGQAFARP